MGVSDNHEMPGHCWDQKPGRDGTRCFEPPGHRGPHFNWYTRDRWPNKQRTDKAAARGIG